ncbi:MAG: DUF4430 domain-containing protein [Eubacterium sp.]|nr:DUF4430 domain-containing protein [Eubacterium sp.]
MDDELLKKARSKHNKYILTVIVLALFAAAFFLGFRIMGPGAGKAGAGGSGSGGSVTISIDCKNLADNMDMLEKPELEKYIPEDGVILEPTEYSFDEGENVYDALEAVCLANDIQLESSEDAVYKSRYIEGINYLYEKDGGKMSGWLFSVNDEVPNYGASKVKLKNGDKIRWFYTVDYAEDSSM